MTCRVCSRDTDVVFVIEREEVPICRGCATEIFIQQARRYAQSGSIYDRPKTVTKPKEYDEDGIREVLDYLYNRLLKMDRKFDTLAEAHKQYVGGRLAEGYTTKQLMSVAYHKWKEWGLDPKMRQHLKFDTLYRPKNFARYVAEVPEEYKPENTKEQRRLLRELNYYIVTGERDDTCRELVEQLKATGYDKPNILNQFTE